MALIVIGILLFAACTTYMNWIKYVSLRSTEAYDLGFFHNSAFNYARGRTITYVLVSAFFDWEDHEGPSVFRSNHFSPMQFLLLPQLYRLWPRIETLMVLQSFIMALGALPLFWFGARRTGDPRLGLVLAGSYLLHPVILHMAFNDYRPIQIGVPLALFALWFHSSRRPLPFAVAALLMLSCRAEFLFVLGLFGVINWRASFPSEGRIRWAVAPLLLAILWAVLTHAYYVYFYGRPWPLLNVAVSREPPEVAIINLLGRLPVFLRIMLYQMIPALLAPEALLSAIPFLAGAKTVRWPVFPHQHLQHLSPAVAIVFWAFACGMVYLWPWLLKKKQTTWALVGLVLSALASVTQFTWAATQTYLVGGFPRYEEMTRINDALPADATVMVPKELMARFSDHTRVFTYRRRMPLGTNGPLSIEEVRTILVELISICDLIATKSGEEGLDELITRSGRYLPAKIVDGFRIYVARQDAPRPSNPDALLQRILRWNQMSETKRRWAKIVAEE